MKIYKWKYLLLGVVVALTLGFYLPRESEDGNRKDKVILNLVYNVLNSSHFAPQEINDDFSVKVYDHFIESLDYSKRFLLEEDLDKLSPYRLELDDEIKNSELAFFESAYNMYRTRFEEAHNYYKEILAEPFDFTIEEDFETDEAKFGFAKDQLELRDRWRKYLKNRVLVRIADRMETQEEAQDKKDTSVTIKSFSEIEKDAREKELEMHEEWFNTLRDFDRIDWIGTYMNSITVVYDPHTQYFPPERQEDFEISMSGQFDGIGAQLQQKGDYVTISKIITGSACWKQGELEVGDKILKVAQEEDKDDKAMDVVGMSVRKVVKYIRGERGTEVRLTVEKLDGSRQVIPIIRDVVELEATFAKSAVLGEGDDKVGYIKLPKFYVDFYNDSNRDCAEDVKKEIAKLKKDNVNGIILDLRNNGGGSLQGVIDIVGLFIEEGPVVQVKAPGRAPQVLEDDDDEVYYDGPLVVMVNQFSASASEIFAAAIQDYKRGLIIGSKSTFGKGTVQNILDMDRAVNFTYNDVKPLGALKLTIQKYYRINGGTPQLRGVNPEIVLPDNYTYIEFGEKEQEHALPYDEIGSAEYQTWKSGTDKFASAIKRSEQRVAGNDKFNLIDEYAQWLKDEQDQSLVSLNYEKYHKDREESLKQSEKYKGMRKTEEEITVSANSDDVPVWNASEDKEKERDQWFKTLKNDLYLSEALAVTQDLE
ncbi:MAG: carboxy terminal-processing peptidase [Owenweeksia sp.]